LFLTLVLYRQDEQLVIGFISIVHQKICSCIFFNVSIIFFVKCIKIFLPSKPYYEFPVPVAKFLIL